MARRRGPAGRRRPWPRRGDPVNVGRGPIVDDTALVRALGNGHLAGAGIEVAWDEPIDPGDELLRENVTVTPHIGGVTSASSAAMHRHSQPTPTGSRPANPSVARRPQHSLSFPTQDPLPRPRSSIVLRNTRYHFTDPGPQNDHLRVLR